MKTQKSSNQLLWTFILIFCFFLLLGIVTPLTGDDWTWGSQIGMDRLSNGYNGYNGRLLSNTLEIILTRFSLVRIFLYATINTLIICFTVNVALPSEKRKSWHYLLTMGLFLTFSTAVFSQTFGWFAGFINYNFGMLLILIYLDWILHGKIKDNNKYLYLQYSGLFFLGLFSALVIEHVTFYLWCLAFATIFYLHRNRVKYLINYLYVTGLIIGSFLMFSNSVYIRIFTGHNSFRHTANHGIINQAIDLYTNQMAKYVFQQNGIIILLLTICLVILVYQNNNGNRAIKSITSFIMLSYAFFVAFIRNLFPASNFNLTSINTLLALASLMYIISLLVSVSYFIKNNNLNHRLWFYILSGLLLSAPFVAITPYGPRCAFNTIGFIIIASLDILNVLLESYNFHAPITKIAFIFGMFAMLLTLSVMSANGYVSHSRTASVNDQLNQHSSIIYVRKLPFQQYVWDSSPSVHRFQYSMYKKRMHISSNQNLKFVPFDKWIK